MILVREYTSYAKAIVEVAQKTEEPKIPLCISVYKRWGSGKIKATVLIHKELKDSMERDDHASSSLCKFFRKPYKQDKRLLICISNLEEDLRAVALCIIIFYPLILPTWIIWKMYDQVTNCFNYDPRNKDQLDDVDKDFQKKFGTFF